jgi:hypothetical protein
VELADSTPTIALPQAKEEIEGFIVDMGEFLCRFPSSFGMGSMKHRHTPDPMKVYRHNHVLQKLVLLAPHWPEVLGFSASTSIPRADDRDTPPWTTQTPAASHTSVPWEQWRLTGTIWENMTMDSMMTMCPDTENNKLWEAIPRWMTAAEVETRFAMHAMMVTSWVCHLQSVPEDNRSTLDEAPTSGLIRLWNELRYQDGGVEPDILTLVVVARAQADGGGVKREPTAV